MSAGCGAVALVLGYFVASSFDAPTAGVLAALVLVPAASCVCAAVVAAVAAEEDGEAGTSGDAWGVLTRSAWQAWAACALVGAFAWLVYAAGEPVLAYCISLVGWVAVPGTTAGWALEAALAEPQEPGANGRSPGSSTSDVDE